MENFHTVEGNGSPSKKRKKRYQQVEKEDSTDGRLERITRRSDKMQAEPEQFQVEISNDGDKGQAPQDAESLIAKRVVLRLAEENLKVGKRKAMSSPTSTATRENGDVSDTFCVKSKFEVGPAPMAVRNRPTRVLRLRESRQKLTPTSPLLKPKNSTVGAIPLQTESSSSPKKNEVSDSNLSSEKSEADCDEMHPEISTDSSSSISNNTAEASSVMNTSASDIRDVAEVDSVDDSSTTAELREVRSETSTALGNGASTSEELSLIVNMPSGSGSVKIPESKVRLGDDKDESDETSENEDMELNAVSSSPNADSEDQTLENRSRSPSPELSENEYEVEEIIDYKLNHYGELYFVKWKGWDTSANTWEPIENLNGCLKALWKFYLSRRAEKEELSKNGRKGGNQVPPDPRPLLERIDEFLGSYRPVTEEEKKKAFEILEKKSENKNFWWERPKLDKWLEDAKDKLNESQKEKLRCQAIFWLVDLLKTAKKKELKKWCKNLNRITKGMPEILVENDYDLEGPPSDFTYVNDYVTSSGVTIPDDPPVGCSCGDNCIDRKSQCCPKGSGFEFAYNSKKRIRVTTGKPVYECNSKCSCPPECPNRVVQDGVTSLKGMKYCIYRTANGCGWGVKTNKAIKKGTYVCLYVGEIIKTDEAERRGKNYDKEGSTYLFDLDFNDKDCPYVVDAKRVGNVSHFMNHSCAPNLEVFGVWVNCLDPNLPKLALFASRDILKDEELCFDYKSRKDDDGESSGEKPLIKMKLCLCGAENCRKMLF